MPTSDGYKRYATVCDNIADTTDDRIERTILLQIARQWRRLADHKAKTAHPPGHIILVSQIGTTITSRCDACWGLCIVSTRDLFQMALVILMVLAACGAAFAVMACIAVCGL